MDKFLLEIRPNGKTTYMFRCPGCDHAHVFDQRWKVTGEGDDLTFAPSLLVWHETGEGRPKYRCHSYVRNGHIQFLGDCTHNLAGETVELERRYDNG